MKVIEAIGKLLTLLRRLRFYEALLLIFIALVIGAWSVKEITESALFCGNTCHIMRPYYEDWKSSSHNHISCVQCHLTPDEGHQFVPQFRALAQVASYLTRTYGRHTRAEVSDSACLREDCHSKRLLEGKVQFLRNVLFDHSPHLQQLRRGKIMRCTTCHSQVAMGSHITVSEGACFTCHFKERNPSTTRCQLCHQIPEGSRADFGGPFDHSSMIQLQVPCEMCHDDVIQGNGDVRPDSCADCHERPREAAAENPVEVMHRKHVTDHKVDCDRCHEPIVHAIPSRTGGAPATDCEACHEGRHRGIYLLYEGRGARDIPESPSPMYVARVACRGCHTLPSRLAGGGPDYTGQTMQARAYSCGTCHPGVREGKLKEQARAIAEALSRAESSLARAEKALAAARPDLPHVASARRTLETARHNVAFIQASIPLHNPDYALAVLSRATEDLNRITSLSR